MINLKYTPFFLISPPLNIKLTGINFNRNSNLLYSIILYVQRRTNNMNETNTIGNTTTIIKMISMTLAGYIIATLTAHNLQLNIDASMLAELIGAIIFLALGYLDAKYPNTFKFLNNNVESEEEEEDITIQ